MIRFQVGEGSRNLRSQHSINVRLGGEDSVSSLGVWTVPQNPGRHPQTLRRTIFLE